MLGSLCWTHTVILSLRYTRARNNSDDITIYSSLRMKPFNLKLVKLDKELLDEFIKHIVAFTHQLGRLLLSHLA